MVAIHGGSWGATYGKVVMRPLAGVLVRQGFAVWNVEYRRLGARRWRGPDGGGWPETFEDVAAAVDYLAAIDAPVDLARVAGLGHSAGGQLILWAAGRYKLAPRAPGANPAVRLSAAVAMAGVVDMTASHAAAPAGAVDRLMGGSPRAVPERYAVGDPIRLVPVDLPVLLVHGTEDQTVSIERSRSYARAAAAAGGDVELVEIAGAAGRHRRHLDPDGPAAAVATGWLGRHSGLASGSGT